MTEIDIPPITGENIDERVAEVQETFLQSGVASALEDWARLVTASTILVPVNWNRMPEPSQERLSGTHDNLEFLMSSQSEEVVGRINPSSAWDIGCIALHHTLEQARDRMLDNPSSAVWPMDSIRLQGITLEVAKTMLHLERFNDLLKSQPDGIALTVFRMNPSRADAVELDSEEDLWSVEGVREVAVPSFGLGVRAELTKGGVPENRLYDLLTVNVDEVISAVENRRIYPVASVAGDTVPLSRQQFFLGNLPRDAVWAESSEMNADRATMYKYRFDLVQSASAQALGDMLRTDNEDHR